MGRRRKRRRRRRGPRGRGLKQMDLRDENAEMRAKIADRLGKSKTGSNVEDRLAKMAGIKKDRKSDQSEHSDHSDVYDSESEDDGDRIRGRMRSDKVKNETSKGKGGEKSSDKWKHDKY